MRQEALEEEELNRRRRRREELEMLKQRATASPPPPPLKLASDKWKRDQEDEEELLMAVSVESDPAKRLQEPRKQVSRGRPTRFVSYAEESARRPSEDIVSSLQISDIPAMKGEEDVPARAGRDHLYVNSFHNAKRDGNRSPSGTTLEERKGGKPTRVRVISGTSAPNVSFLSLPEDPAAADFAEVSQANSLSVKGGSMREAPLASSSHPSNELDGKHRSVHFLYAPVSPPLRDRLSRSRDGAD